MTALNFNNNLNNYLHTNLIEDLQRIQKEVLSETSRNQYDKSSNVVDNSNTKEIIDEYVPFLKPKVEVTFEERMSQVISPEEVKNLLSLILRAPRFETIPGDLVDVKG